MNQFNTGDYQMPVTVTTRIEKDLAQVIDEVAKKEGLDRSTVIRRFLTQAAKEWLIEKNLKNYEQGKITLWQAATTCDMSLWEMIEEAKKREIHVPYTIEEFRKDMKGI
jgi:predicted HTH domain antitoxin